MQSEVVTGGHAVNNKNMDSNQYVLPTFETHNQSI